MIRIHSGRTLVNYLQILSRTRLSTGASGAKFGERGALGFSPKQVARASLTSSYGQVTRRRSSADSGHLQGGFFCRGAENINTTHPQPSAQRWHDRRDR